MANEACDSCLIDQFGFLASGSYPYSLAGDQPDRVYCVSGVPVVPPSRGAIAPVVGDWTGTPTDDFGSMAFTAQSEHPAVWVNRTGRTCSVVALMTGFAGSLSAVNTNTIKITLTLAESGGSSSTVVASFSQAAGASFSGATGVVTVAAGAGVTARISGQIVASTDWEVSYVGANIILFGGSA